LAIGAGRSRNTIVAGVSSHKHRRLAMSLASSRYARRMNERDQTSEHSGAAAADIAALRQSLTSILAPQRLILPPCANR